LQELVGQGQSGAPIGHYALGEYIYADQSKQTILDDWMQRKAPEMSLDVLLSLLVPVLANRI
jgi:hypothetical protein